MNSVILMSGLLSLLFGVTTANTRSYVAFVVDDTGSMGQEIEAVKQWLKDCVAGTHAFCGGQPSGGWIVTTFNDPSVGPVFGPSTNQNQVRNRINSIRARGGGDYPELALTGQRNAINMIPNSNGGCKVYTFTDAVPKDQHLHPQVLNLMFAKNCEYFPVLSGCDDKVKRKCASCISIDPALCEAILDGRKKSGRRKRQTRSSKRPGEALYYEQAKRTGGRAFLVDKPKTSKELVDFLEKTVVLGFCPTKRIAGPPNRGYAEKRDCERAGQCWDKGSRKCYCKSTTRCPTDPVCPEKSLAGLHYPHPVNCNQYFSFSGGLQTKTCPKGKVYDRRCRNCNYRHYVTPKCGTYRG